jgi:class 3 adenylate cyclase
MDRPLLVLAVLTMILYLFDLRGMMHWSVQTYRVVTLLIDLVFVFDLVVKLTAYGSRYIRTPWFLIDLLSCLPVLEGIVSSVVSIRAVRIIRGFRILRILRGLRVLRALRAIPVFEHLMNELPPGESGRKFHSAMNGAMVGMTIALLAIIVLVRKGMEREYLLEVDAVAGHEVNPEQLKKLAGTFEPPDDTNYVTQTVLVDGRPRTAYFDRQVIDDRSNEYEFYLIVGMMLMMLFFLYIMAYHQLDVSQTQLRALLNLALPKQVAERFMRDPTAYGQKSRTPAAVMFMDFVGFTQACERLARDPDTISMHLETAMDRLVSELVEHDLIIDKFIGDAIMSFRGGPLVTGDLGEHAYRAVRAALDSIKALEKLNDPYFKRVKIGGTSSDDCLIGAFGTSARLSYTILGDGVNLAARLEPASGQCGTQNLFCENTYRLCAAQPDLTWRRWGRIRVAGKSEPIEVFEAFDSEGVGEPLFITTYHRGLEAFERNDFEPARELFVLADSQRKGGDEPARYFAQWCDELLLVGPPVGWEPVFDTHK